MLKYAHVQPVITPRFAISCTMPLMTRLAELSRKYNLNIQVKYYDFNVDHWDPFQPFIIDARF